DGFEGRGLERPEEDAIVRRDEVGVESAYSDRAAGTADAGIDDDEVHRSGGEVSMGGAEQPRRLHDVLRRNVVRDIDDPDLAVDAEDHTLHGGDVGVARAEVGEER